MAANHDAAMYPKRFLRILFGDHLGSDGLALEIRCIPTTAGDPVLRKFFRDHSEIKKGWTDLARLNEKKYQIYFGVALRKKTKEGYEVPDPAILTCLWADIDVGADKPNKSIADVHARLRKVGTKPTIVVESGHGIHAYWVLRKIRHLQAEEAKKLLRGMASATAGDLQSAEVARLLRMPNTINWKEEKGKVLQMPKEAASQGAQQ